MSRANADRSHHQYCRSVSADASGTADRVHPGKGSQEICGRRGYTAQRARHRADCQARGSGWKLENRDVYDEDYEDRYLREEIYPLKTSTGGLGSLAKRVDRAAQVVDVKIVFK